MNNNAIKAKQLIIIKYCKQLNLLSRNNSLIITFYHWTGGNSDLVDGYKESNTNQGLSLQYLVNQMFNEINMIYSNNIDKNKIF